MELFKRIRGLGTGEALVFAPSAVVRREEGEEEWGKVSEGVLKVRGAEEVDMGWGDVGCLYLNGGDPFDPGTSRSALASNDRRA